MTEASPRATFRDPAGSLRFDGELAVRSIAPSARAEVLDFLGSPLCQAMQQRGDLIAAAIDDSGPQLILRHPRIPVPTYPWEWTPAQWIAAANLTLDLCDQAIAAGWVLKDATPLNVLLWGRDDLDIALRNGWMVRALELKLEYAIEEGLPLYPLGSDP